MYKVAIVGATGLVGTKIAEVLERRGFPVSELIPAASERSVGKIITFKGREYSVVTPEEAIARKPHIAIFSAGAAASAKYAPQFAAVGCRVIDNSSFWRTDPSKKLIVPEVNGDAISEDDFIIANPNYSTIQMVVALAPLHRKYKIKRIVVSTYQSVTGSGQKGISQLLSERDGVQNQIENAYKHQIDLNLIPQIDLFLENGYTKEEMKMVNETHKILSDNTIAVSATTVRVPVKGGHSESINVTFEQIPQIEEVRNILINAPGVVLQDSPQESKYPMPIEAEGSDMVFVGRIRKDLFCEHSVNMWVVADNLLKGAATNAVQIAEFIISHFKIIV